MPTRHERLRVEVAKRRKACDRADHLVLVTEAPCRVAAADRSIVGGTVNSDQLVAQARGGDDHASGRVAALYDAEAWASAVNLGELLTDAAAALRRHVVLPDASRDVVALWAAHTWVYDKFDHSPRLGITLPRRRCGKSTLIDVLRIMCQIRAQPSLAQTRLSSWMRYCRMTGGRSSRPRLTSTCRRIS
jgi:hypothetical protein